MSPEEAYEELSGRRDAPADAGAGPGVEVEAGAGAGLTGRGDTQPTSGDGRSGAAAAEGGHGDTASADSRSDRKAAGADTFPKGTVTWCILVVP